jgi:hypothetical protein
MSDSHVALPPAPDGAVLHFESRDVDAWAEFSGDYNPVHFDADHAHAAGLEGLIVHGMLALLHVKHAVSKATDHAALCGSTWLKFRALLRNPVTYGRKSVLSLRPTGHGLDFRLRAMESGREQFRGTFAPIEPPANLKWGGAGDKLDGALLVERTASLLTAYPYIDECWVALDAIIFAEFIRTKLAAIEQSILPVLASSPQGVGRGMVVYQLSHAVRFDSVLLRLPPHEIERLGSLSYFVPNEVDQIHANGQVVGTVEIPVVAATGPLMTLEIGLMARVLLNNSSD